jgi:hypothetical protein
MPACFKLAPSVDALGNFRAWRDSNPRPPGSKPDTLSS